MNARAMRSAVITGAVGNIMEWYDFALYGFFAPTIGRLFFPSDDAVASLLAAFAVFASGFLVRPLGGVIFGHYGDRLGRRVVLAASVILMAVPTFAIGLLPTYAQVGVLAPLLLVLARLFQGISSGGEYSGAISYLLEHAPPSRRGLIGSTAPCAAFAGILLGSGVSALVTNSLPSAALETWGWRLPFLLGLVVGAVGLYLRLRGQETPEFLALIQASATARAPLREALQHERRALLITAGFTVLPSLAFWLVFTYMPTYLSTVVGVPAALALSINTVGTLVLVLLTPLAGALSDRIGRKPVLLAASLGYAIVTYPLFLLLSEGSSALVMLALAIFAVLSGLFGGAMPAAMAEMFPTRVRYSALALGYNTVESLVGGTAPLVGTYLVAATHSNLAPSWYLILAAVITLGVVSRCRETYRDPLK